MFSPNAKTHKYRDFFRDMKVKKCQKTADFLFFKKENYFKKDQS